MLSLKWSLTLVFIGSALGAWQPQLGTVEHPKVPGSWPNARRGDVIAVGDELFVALRDIQDLGLVSSDNLDGLKPLERGSFLRPKSPTVDDVEKSGEIFFDPTRSEYYRSACAGSASQCLQPLDVKSEWMTLANDVIGDLRLGDLTLPGSHDAGTEGCNSSSYLVDNTFLFGIAKEVAPEVVANWSRTQQDDLGPQLEAGFRYFDLRIADIDLFDPPNNSSFRWWHGLSADVIFEGLGMIANFAFTHPQEVIILDFDHFAAPDPDGDGTIEIPEDRMDLLTEILLLYLGEVLVNQSLIEETAAEPLNPTVNEILATGKNVIAIVAQEYMEPKSDLFWPDIISYGFSGAGSPEELFLDRSALLESFVTSDPDRITKASGCVTPDTRIVTAGLKITFGDNRWIGAIIDSILPEDAAEVDPSVMSFEGLWVDLVNMAGRGVNTAGMLARDPEQYSYGSSVQYRGLNDIYRFWNARPQKYKRSIIFADDCTDSSTFVDTAILANTGQLKREVTISFQGTTTHGYYEWVNFTNALYGDDAYRCDPVDVTYSLTVGSTQITRVLRSRASEPFEVTFLEGEFPADADVTLEVSSAENSEVYTLFTSNIQEMIDSAADVYVRGTDLNGINGFAYTSGEHNLFPGAERAECENFPLGDFDTIEEW